MSCFAFYPSELRRFPDRRDCSCCNGRPAALQATKTLRRLQATKDLQRLQATKALRRLQATKDLQRHRQRQTCSDTGDTISTNGKATEVLRTDRQRNSYARVGTKMLLSSLRKGRRTFGIKVQYRKYLRKYLFGLPDQIHSTLSDFHPRKRGGSGTTFQHPRIWLLDALLVRCYALCAACPAYLFRKMVFACLKMIRY